MQKKNIITITLKDYIKHPKVAKHRQGNVIIMNLVNYLAGEFINDIVRANGDDPLTINQTAFCKKYNIEESLLDLSLKQIMVNSINNIKVDPNECITHNDQMNSLIINNAILNEKIPNHFIN
jgi:hypothetical protein